MGIYKVADGAFFVPSYSLQTITPAFDTATTVQALGGESELDEQRHDKKDEKDKAVVNS